MIAEVLVKDKAKEKIKEKTYTIEEYFQMEEKASHKSEFRNGKIIAMPGGTYAHSRIQMNISGTLFNTIDGEEYEVVNSDHAIYIPKFNHSVYSDTCIIKGEPEFYNQRAILNPIVIFEVASKSTEKYDRHGKFNKYKTIPSFTEYVIIDQEMPIVEVFYKQGEIWGQKSYIGLNETMQLESIQHELKMVDIYKKIKGLLDPQAILNL